MSKKIQWRKTCAIIMSVCMVISNMMITDVRAEEKEAVEEVTSGDYVILVENELNEIVEEMEDEETIAQNKECVIYEAELSQQEIKQLEQEKITVEENIYLLGADSKKHSSKEKKPNK